MTNFYFFSLWAVAMVINVEILCLNEYENRQKHRSIKKLKLELLISQ